ncbi:hypothetical protein [Mycoplasma sp. B6400]|uniref:hypothetical protein n=1 Tax=Mycoplasma sp. B6400 TaxID=3401674 RepID=UPI003AAFF99A
MKYEYKIMTVSSKSDLEWELCRWGRAGWRVASVIYDSNFCEYVVIVESRENS